MGSQGEKVSENHKYLWYPSLVALITHRLQLVAIYVVVDEPNDGEGQRYLHTVYSPGDSLRDFPYLNIYRIRIQTKLQLWDDELQEPHGWMSVNGRTATVLQAW